MKTVYLIIATALLLACDDKKDNTQNALENTAEATVLRAPEPQANTAGSTLLCKINGENWYYTKASGVVEKSDNIGFRRTIVTFKNKLDKGSEAIQIEYNTETNEVTRVLVNIKRTGTDGKRFGTMYNMRVGYMKAGESMTGTIDITDLATASGTATIGIENDYDKAKLNPEDHFLKITDLQYSGVGYSDINREFDKYKNQ